MIQGAGRKEETPRLSEAAAGGELRGKALEYAECTKQDYPGKVQDTYDMWMVILAISVATGLWVAYEFVRKKDYVVAFVAGLLATVLLPAVLFLAFALLMYVLHSFGI